MDKQGYLLAVPQAGGTKNKIKKEKKKGVTNNELLKKQKNQGV